MFKVLAALFLIVLLGACMSEPPETPGGGGQNVKADREAYFTDVVVVYFYSDT